MSAIYRSEVLMRCQWTVSHSGGLQCTATGATFVRVQSDGTETGVCFSHRDRNDPRKVRICGTCGALWISPRLIGNKKECNQCGTLESQTLAFNGRIQSIIAAKYEDFIARNARNARKKEVDDDKPWELLYQTDNEKGNRRYDNT